ncbi:MAG TPA: hypothetical protein VG347_10985, partial [Verrucomicrobiae bacterium]|nr:hypothetical protein [Verrucomicrobiae bacterium]
NSSTKIAGQAILTAPLALFFFHRPQNWRWFNAAERLSSLNAHFCTTPFEFPTPDVFRKKLIRKINRI